MLCPPGDCSIVAVMLPSRIWASASGKASKPISLTLPRRLRAFSACKAPERHVVIGADDDVGRGLHAVERRFGHRKALGAIEAGGVLEHELVFARPPCRERCEVPCCGRWRGSIPTGPGGSSRSRRWGTASSISSPCASPPLTLSAPTWASMPGTLSTRRSTVTTGILASTASCTAGRQCVHLVGIEEHAVDALGDRRLDVGRLLGRTALAIGDDEVDAAESSRLPPSSLPSMWAKNGNAMSGMVTRIVRCLSAA